MGRTAGFDKGVDDMDAVAGDKHLGSVKNEAAGAMVGTAGAPSFAVEDACVIAGDASYDAEAAFETVDEVEDKVEPQHAGAAVVDPEDVAVAVGAGSGVEGMEGRRKMQGLEIAWEHAGTYLQTQTRQMTPERDRRCALWVSPSSRDLGFLSGVFLL